MTSQAVRDQLADHPITTVGTVKTFGVPVVHSMVNVASGQVEPTIPPAVIDDFIEYNHIRQRSQHSASSVIGTNRVG